MGLLDGLKALAVPDAPRRTERGISYTCAAFSLDVDFNGGNLSLSVPLASRELFATSSCSSSGHAPYEKKLPLLSKVSMDFKGVVQLGGDFVRGTDPFTGRQLYDPTQYVSGLEPTGQRVRFCISEYQPYEVHPWNRWGSAYYLFSVNPISDAAAKRLKRAWDAIAQELIEARGEAKAGPRPS